LAMWLMLLQEFQVPELLHKNGTLRAAVVVCGL